MSSLKAEVFGHTYDRVVDADNGSKFSLDSQTPYPTDLDNIDDEVKGAMHSMQRQGSSDTSQHEVPRELWEHRPHASLGGYFPL